MKKIIIHLGLFLVLALLVSCSKTAIMPKEQVDAQLSELSDDELKGVIDESAREEEKALAGQAVKPVTVGAIQAPSNLVYTRALVEQNKRLSVPKPPKFITGTTFNDIFTKTKFSLVQEEQGTCLSQCEFLDIECFNDCKKKECDALCASVAGTEEEKQECLSKCPTASEIGCFPFTSKLSGRTWCCGMTDSYSFCIE